MGTSQSTLVLPAGISAPIKGHVDVFSDPVLMKNLGIAQALMGSVGGYNTEGDVIQTTIDGVDLGNIWQEFQQTIALANAERQALVDFLSYGVSTPTVTVPQFGGGEDFEVASEFGVPRAVSTQSSYFEMGFAFEWYDMAGRFTWKFLAEATSSQVESIHQAVLEADNRLVFNEVMKTLFDNTNRVADIRNRAYTVYSLYNGDGTVPPTYKTNTFDGSHSHYLVSGAATVDAGDLDDMQTHLNHHGYTASGGVDLVLMVNKEQGDTIRQFRSIANGGTAKFDFIPAQGTPSFLIPRDLVQGDTSRPPATYRGMKVLGAYGDFTIVEEDYIPAGYMVAFGTGGPQSLTNPVGIREHANTALRGLRLVKGRSNDYPLQDAYYQRGFGTGVRQRGAAVIMQVKASGTYAPPAQYAR